MKFNKKYIALFLIVFGVTVSGILIYWYAAQDRAPDISVSETVRKDEKNTVTARRKTVTEWYEAVGTLRPKSETIIGSEISAQVVDVLVRAGDVVEKDQVLVLLDSRRMSARVSQAQEAMQGAISQKQQMAQMLNAAKAAFHEAEAEYQRVKNYFEQQAATRQELERAESRFLQARAGIKQAEDAVDGALAGIRQAEDVLREARISLGFTQVKAPVQGEVIKRLIEPGDLALPGKPLVSIKTSGTLQLEAFVREGLIQKVSLGSTLSALITSLNHTTSARVEEIIPYADPRTRTFLVKAMLPPMEGIYPGMYGKLLIPFQSIEVVLVPPEAIRRVGQLEMVRVKADGDWKTRYIKTGQIHDGMVEVLSGLSGNETLAVSEFENDRS